VFEALGLGTLAQSSLLLAGLFVCYVTVPRRLVGVLAGFGAGALIAAVSFDLIAEADELPSWEMALWMLIGVAVFLGGDALVERRFGSEGAGASMGIVVGSVVDGVPESIIFGIQVATGFPISVSFLAAVFVSNIPQAIAIRRSRGVRLEHASPRIALALRRARLRRRGCARLPRGGRDERGERRSDGRALMPFAYDRGGAPAGAATVVGFCVSLLGT
jgi:zinc transporter, ZIP family